MKIIDVNGKEREVKDDIKVVEHTRSNDCLAVKKENVDGELVEMGDLEVVEVTEKFVEATVVGKSGREWTEWYQLEKFQELNPGVKL